MAVASGSVRARRIGRFFTVLAAVALSFPLAGAAETGSAPKPAAASTKKLTLSDFIRLALSNAPELEVAGMSVAERLADLQQAQASQFLPEFEALNATGIARRARGTVLDPKDSVSVDAFGPFTRVEVQLVQPLFTFGKISSGIEAATHAVGAEIAARNGVAVSVIEQVKTLYYNIVLSRSVGAVLSETTDGFGSALETARERREDGDVDISELDILYLRVGRSEVAKELPRLVAGERGALQALRVLAGAEPEDPLDVRDARLEPAVAELEPLDHYRARLYEQNPSWRQIQEGVAAKEQELNKTVAEYFPDFFITGQFGYAYAPDRTRQLNPFAWDDFNFLRGPGGVLGVRWPLNFHVTATKVQKARAELGKLEAERRRAKKGLMVELDNAYWTAVEARKSLGELDDGRKAGRAILTLSVTNFDLAIGDAAEILNALGNYARVSTSYYEAVRDLNLALAVLSRVLGEEVVPVLRKSEKIEPVPISGEKPSSIPIMPAGVPPPG